MEDKNRIIIFDTTMRDGEQSPGASMSLEEKIQISRVFDELGIDIIEAGFPIAIPGDYEAVTAISKILKKSTPAGLARHTKKDIDACHEALKSAKKLPLNLLDALRVFDNNKVLKLSLGEEFSNAYISLKKDEWNAYASHFSVWEKENTLDI